MRKQLFEKVTLCIFTFTMSVILCSSVKASPAYPYPITITQPDGTILTIQLEGDEFVKRAKTTDGYTLMFNADGIYEYAVTDENQNLIPSGILARNESERDNNTIELLKKTPKELTYSSGQLSMMKSIKGMVEKERAERAFPTTGNRKLVCILIGFKDRSFSKSRNDFYNLFNQIGYSVDGASGSVKDFYKENSYGKLNLSVTVTGPYTAANNMSYYGGNNSNNQDKNPRALITEAVKAANKDVNYDNFDNDNDGTVDGIYVIYAGYGEEAGGSANAIWAHAWSISTITLDGKKINRYSCSAELRGNSGSGISRIGVICHEFGHVAGAPDYYDTDYSKGGQFSGTGRWDCMAGGSWNNGGATPAHHNPYTKVYIYKWASATTLSSTKTITLNNAATNSNSFYRYNTTTTNEYYLVENRQKAKFDAHIPGHGMLIYHVHKDIGNRNINITHPQKMYPVCASATSNPSSTPSSYGSINSSGCPFPGSGNKTSFTDATTPNSRSWAGNKTNKSLINIKESGGKITFDFQIPCTPLAKQNDRTLYGDVNGDGRDELIFVNTSYCGGAIRVTDAVSGKTMLWKNHVGSDFRGWMDNSDKALVGDVNGDKKDDLVLINTHYSGGAIRAIDLTSGNTIKWINHSGSGFNGWMDSSDKMFIGDINGDKKEDLVLVNTNYSGGAIRSIDIMTGNTIKWIDHSDGGFGGWMDSSDKMFLGDVNADSKKDLVLVNTNYSGGAIRAVNLTSGTNIKWINHSGAGFNGWMDSSDKMFLGDVNGDKKEDLVLINTNYSGGAIRSVDIMSGNTIKWLDHNGGGFNGWMDSSDKMFLGDVNADNKKDIVLVNTNYSGGAIRAVNLITGATLKWIDHSGSGFSGWMDSSDRMRLFKANADNKADLVLINTNYSGGAVWVKDIMNNSTILWLNHSTAGLSGWLDGFDTRVSQKSFMKDSDTTEEGESVVTNELSRNENNVSIFPNPTSGILNVHIVDNLNNISEVELINITGTTVYKNSIINEDMEIDMTNQPSGIYILNIKTKTNTKNFRVIKK